MNIRKSFIAAAMCLCALAAGAQGQFYGLNVDKLNLLLSQTEKLPRDNAELVLRTTLTALQQNPKGYHKALEVIERLGDPADSLHCEPLYLLGLQHAVESSALTASEKTRPQALLASAKKNAVGTAAADLALTDRNGKAFRLSDISAPFVLLYFNSPDCDACQQVKQQMESSATLRKAVDDGRLKVVAVATGCKEKQWKKAVYPDWVINGFDKSGQIEQDDVYVLPTQPLFYLLGAERTVLLRNEPSLTRVESALGKLAADPEATTPAQQAADRKSVV